MNFQSQIGIQKNDQTNVLKIRQFLVAKKKNQKQVFLLSEQSVSKYTVMDVVKCKCSLSSLQKCWHSQMLVWVAKFHIEIGSVK